MINIIFLGINGILNVDYASTSHWVILFEKINQIIERLDSQNEIKTKIVISSSWRSKFSLLELIKMFQSFGLKGEIIDITPQIPRRRMSEYISRGEEIQTWLNETKEKINKFIILDNQFDLDNQLVLNDLKKFLIKINHKNVLTDADINKAINMLLD